MSVTVRSLAAEEWALWRDLRLAALAESPSSFGSTLAEAEDRTDAEWHLAPGDHERYLVAFVDGAPAGMAYIGIPRSGAGQLYAMWVVPRFRRRGAGSALLSNARSFALSRGAVRIDLTSPLSPAPLGMYRKAGYRETGRRRPLREGSATLVVEMRLELAP